MRLTAKGRYAVTAMLDLALHNNQGPVSVAELSRRQTISQSYLEHLLGTLHQRHLVESVRGPGGGYFLSKALTDITVADIIQAVDETIDATQCRGKLDCHDGERCMTHQLWADLNMQIEAFLASVSLSQLVADQRHRADAELPLTLLRRGPGKAPPTQDTKRARGKSFHEKEAR